MARSEGSPDGARGRAGERRSAAEAGRRCGGSSLRAGRAVGIGHASRNVPGYLRRELFHRDGGCTFPGCGTRRFLDAHHVWHWEAGGPTDLDNLVLVCRFHHKLVHELGWRVDLDEDQVARWFRPGGRRYEPDLQQAGRALPIAS